MPSKFLNLSTDDTLGGNSPSDDVAVSQKAIKKYVDDHGGGGGSASVDGTTISRNTSDELQAIAVMNKNTAVGATNPVCHWVGTLQEYTDQNIATQHPDWISVVTDEEVPFPTDNISTSTNSVGKLQSIGVINQNDTTTAIKTWTGTKAQYDAIVTKDANTLYSVTDDTNISLTILEALYPVGSIYITTANSCPLSALISGSTWTLVSSGRVLQGADTNHEVGTTVEAGLPNITGNATLGASGQNAAIVGYWYGEGALSSENVVAGGAVSGSGSSATARRITFDASRSSSIYGNSTTVQPPAYCVNIFERTA